MERNITVQMNWQRILNGVLFSNLLTLLIMQSPLLCCLARNHGLFPLLITANNKKKYWFGDKENLAWILECYFYEEEKCTRRHAEIWNLYQFFFPLGNCLLPVFHVSMIICGIFHLCHIIYCQESPPQPAYFSLTKIIPKAPLLEGIRKSLW